MVLTIKNESNNIVINFCFSRNRIETKEAQMHNGRIKVKIFSPHISVKNLTHIGLNINKVNNPNVSQ